MGALIFLKHINITLGLSEIFEECHCGVLFLVKLQAYRMLLDQEMKFSKILPGF